jgi:hypothetical protein
MPENLILLYPNKFTRINDRLHITSPDLITLMSSVESDHSFKNFKEVCETYNNRWPGPSDLAQQAFLHVVTETVFDYPTVFISEKSIRPILYKRPFVIASSVGCLDNIIKIIDSICAKSITELQELCIDMQDILDYNFNYYKTEFKKKELEKFDSACRKNLGIR